MPNTSNPVLKLTEVMLRDADMIIAARNKAKILHATNDIDTSGNEVETAVRAFLTRRLPSAFHVGRGHIVDRTWATSPDFDLLIVDKLNQPVLFEAEDSTAYYPYEAIFAIGEVKSTFYSSSKPLHEFCDRIRLMKSRLTRIKNTIKIPRKDGAHQLSYPQNQLLTFMVCVSSNDFSLADHEDLLKSCPASELPNFVCLLDKGVLVNFQCKRNERGFEMHAANLYPEFNPTIEGVSHHWALVPFGDQKSRPGAALAFMLHFLVEHLSKCNLTETPYLEYVRQMLDFEGGDLIY